MVKQKVVMKLSSLEDAKKRTKALKTAVGLPGVNSATLDGNKLTVAGDGIDVIELTTMLRKRVGYAEIDRVTTGDDKKESGKKETGSETKSSSVQPAVSWPYHLNTVQPYPYAYVVPAEPNYDPSCSIM